MTASLRLVVVSIIGSVLGLGGCGPTDPPAAPLSVGAVVTPAKVAVPAPRPEGMADVAPVLDPPAFTLSPGGTHTFTISSGDPPFVRTLMAGSGPTASAVVNGRSVVYTAGSTGSTTDTLFVTDADTMTSNTVTITLNTAVVASPLTANVLPGGTQPFSAAGGDKSYTWSLASSSGGNLSSTSGSPIIYTAGTTKTDVVDIITLSDHSGGSTTVNVNVGHNAISITDGAVTVPPKGTHTFTATGGVTGGYTWTISSSSPGPGHNGTIDMTTGTYTAGATGSSTSPPLTDTVEVSDTMGNTATVVVTLGAPLGISVPKPTVPGGTVETVNITGGSGTVASWAFASMGQNTGTTSNVTTDGSATGGTYTAGHLPLETDTIVATDTLGNTATATISTSTGITITPNPSLSTTPKGTINFTASGGSNAGFVWTLPSPPSGGKVTNNGDGSATYVAGATGGVSDTITVTDGNGNPASATIMVSAGITFTHSETMSAPKGTFTFVATGGNDSIKYTLSPADPNPSGGSIGLTSGAYTAGPTANTTDTVIATDTLGNTNSVQVAVGGGITISPNAPSVFPKSKTALSASGGSGSGYTYSLEASPHGSIVQNMDGSYSYVAGLGSPTGNLTDTITATDSLTNTASTTITILPAISLDAATVSVAPLGKHTFSASGGNGVYTWSLNPDPSASGGTIDSSGNYQAGTTGSVNGGTQIVDVVQVVDTLGNVATANVKVTPALSLSADHTSVPPLGTATFTASGGNNLSYDYTITTAGSSGTILATIGKTTGVYKAGNVGGTGITDTITVEDANGVTTTKSISVTAGVSITPSLAATAPGGTLSFTASGGSGTGFTWSVSTNNSQTATIGSSGATVTYTAGSTDGVFDMITVSDSLGNVATVNVSVGGIAIGPATPMAPPHGTLTFMAVGGTGSGFKWKVSPSASGGSINSTTGVYVAGGTGNVKDTVVVTDSGGNHSQVLVSVGAPVSITPTMSMQQAGGTQSFSVTGGSGMGYVWSLSTNSTGATITTDGAYTAGTVSGTDIVQVVDSLGSAAVATVTVSVPVVDLPDMGAADMASVADDLGRIPFEDGGEVPDAAVAKKSKGSGCDLGGAGSASPLALLLGATMIVLLRRRRVAR